MKIVSFTVGSQQSYGLMRDNGIVDVGRRCGGTVLDHLADMAVLADHESAQPDFQVDEVHLLPPVANSSRIICIGLNYKTHIAETGHEPPAYPILFPRYPGSLVGSGAPLVRPRVSDRFDFEGELAFVIGRPGRHIPAERALDHVAGYACLNDGSIRDFQRHTSQFLPGKNFDRSGSFGPWLVTPDEVGDIGSLQLTTRLNGEIVQQACIDDLLFGVEALIAYISQIWEVRPGDVIATGTTGGVGAARNPQLWMKPGDCVEVEIDRLGTLTNSVISEEALP